MSRRAERRRKARAQQQASNAKNNNRWRTITLVTVALVVAGAAIMWFIPGSPLEPVTMDDDAAAALFHLEGRPILGSPDAPVAVVEFGDYKCPHCKTFHQSVLSQLMIDYIESGQVKYSFFHFPFMGDDSTTAARAAQAVAKQDPEAFWAFHDAIFARQGDTRVRWATEDFLLELAQLVAPGLDQEQLAQDMKSREVAQEVQRDLNLGRSLGVNGTPTVFVNGVKTQSPGYDAVAAAIEQALAQAAGGGGR